MSTPGSTPDAEIREMPEIYVRPEFVVDDISCLRGLDSVVAKSKPIHLFDVAAAQQYRHVVGVGVSGRQVEPTIGVEVAANNREEAHYARKHYRVGT